MLPRCLVVFFDRETPGPGGANVFLNFRVLQLTQATVDGHAAQSCDLCNERNVAGARLERQQPSKATPIALIQTRHHAIDGSMFSRTLTIGMTLALITCALVYSTTF